MVLVGEGRERDHLIQQAKLLRIERIRFLSSVPHEEIPLLLNCADALAITSLHEAGPLIVPEAIACSVPVVTLDVGRVQEFVNSYGTGRIYR